jgi:galactan endo-1,6-beta-galactosidase
MYPQVLVLAIYTFFGCPFVEADTTTTINPTSDWGTWEGWGVSLAWWAKAFGDRDDLADTFFTLDTITVGTQNLPGLGLNIVRYNAGAWSWNTYGGETKVIFPDMIASRQMDGYWLDWASTDPSTTSWSWDIDSNQRNAFLNARERGVNIFELFSNSPMWWMCNNYNPSGSDGGSSDNLQSWNYDQHAVYLATIAKYATDNWVSALRPWRPLMSQHLTGGMGRLGHRKAVTSMSARRQL